jgi:hypothetical protein
MLRKKTGIARAIAASIAAVALLAAAPQTALAAKQGIWSQWAHEVISRPTKAEIPFAILFTLPAMIAITPFYWAQAALAKMKGGDEDEDENEYEE